MNVSGGRVIPPCAGRDVQASPVVRDGVIAGPPVGPGPGLRTALAEHMKEES